MYLYPLQSLIKQSSLDEQQDPTLLGLDVDCPGGPEPDDELGEFGRTLDAEQGNVGSNDQVFTGADGEIQNDRDTTMVDEKAPGPAGQQPSLDRPRTPVPAPKGKRTTRLTSVLILMIIYYSRFTVDA